MTLDAHNAIETARWTRAAKQHGYQNAISRWPWSPIPYTPRPGSPEWQEQQEQQQRRPRPRPEHQRPKFGGRQHRRYPEAA